MAYSASANYTTDEFLGYFLRPDSLLRAEPRPAFILWLSLGGIIIWRWQMAPP